MTTSTVEQAQIHAEPGMADSVVEVKERYENFIGGHWIAPTTEEYRANLAPATAQPICEVAYSAADDVELALDAAHAAKGEWGEASPAERAGVLNAMADAVEANLEMLAVAESWENGKPVRETLGADLPLVVDHLRYFAGAVRSEEGRISEIDKNTYAHHYQEPLGVVGQIIPFNFPLLMAAWKIAPALAAGNCTVVKPASPTPWSILKFAEVIEDVVPPGVINIVNGPGAEIGKALASSKRIAKIAFTGETVTGRLIMQYAAQNLIPSTTELGGKSPNVFFEDVMAADDDFLDKAIEGLVLYAFNKGEVCTAPSRALIQESIYEKFMERVIERIEAIRQGHPLDESTMLGPQVSAAQLEKIENYVQIGLDEGAELLTGGHRPELDGSSPTVTSSSQRCSRGTTRCASSRRRSSGRSCRSPPSRTSMRRLRSPTTPRTGSEPASGLATAPVRSAWAAGSRRGACGPIATTSTRRTRRSVATRTQGWAARITA